jgi:hypothetical protein
MNERCLRLLRTVVFAGVVAAIAGLREAGADLDFVVARRAVEKAWHGGCVCGTAAWRTGGRGCRGPGFNVANDLHAVRVEDKNRPGIAAELTQKLADAGINLRGLSSAVIEPRFMLYIGLDTAADAARAYAVLR